MTRALAAEWSSKGINVNAICPGYFYTPLTKETLDSDFFQANAKTMIPAERYGNEGELDTKQKLAELFLPVFISCICVLIEVESFLHQVFADEEVYGSERS